MNFFNHFFFRETVPLIEKSKTAHVVEADMLPLPKRLNPREISFPEDGLNWKSGRHLLLSILKISKSEVSIGYSWYLASSLFSLSTPWLVNQFISRINSGVVQDNLWSTLGIGALLGFCGMASGLCLQHYFYRALGAYQVVNSILNKRIFEHSLRLTIKSRQNNQIGDIVNHMSTDSESAADFTFVFGDLASNVFMIIGIVIMLFHFLGKSAIAALLVLLLLAPLTKYIAKKFSKLDEDMMAFRDKRVTMMTQALNAIRVVKYFAWEKSVEKEVMEVRNLELNSRKRLARSEVLSGMAYMAVSTIVLFVALATHAWRGEKLDAALIFTCVSLFGLLEGPFGELSHLLSRLTNGYVGAGRIINFLKQEVLPENQNNVDDEVHTIGIKLTSVDAHYDILQHPTLKSISLDIKPGESVAIVGGVGSGKSSLLLSVLGELKMSKGDISFTGIKEGKKPKLAYLPQEAYIVNATLLENILFGQKFDSAEIRKAVHHSVLEKDLKSWTSGLRTEIGEKGVNLSGGQKQRVGLARAYMQKPQAVLLDDPLSAVDGATEDLLCNRLIFGAWKDLTRIVATHRLEHLNRFDQIVFLENGVITACGKLEKLLLKSKAFNDFYAEHAKSRSEDQSDVAAPIPAEIITADLTFDQVHLPNPMEEEVARITEDEDREVGAVKSSIYFDYLKSLGGKNTKTNAFILTALVIGALAVALAPLLQKWWLAYFSTHSNDWTAIEGVAVYGIIGITVLLLSLSNSLFWLNRGMKAGKAMHDDMLVSVLRAPVRFFDSTPVGRIIQRFSRDVESVDVYLQWSFVSIVNSLLQVGVSLFLILGLMPLMIVVVVPVMWVYYLVQRNYRRPAREAKRFDSIARSPRYAHFKETLQGLTVIRSYGKENWFMESFYDKLAESHRMFYSHYMLNRWFSSRIPIVGGFISMTTAMGVALSAYYGYMNAGTAGLVTLYSLSFWGYLNWGVRVFADIESRMTSIERLKFFANLPAEEAVVKAEEKVPSNWPTNGEVVVRDVKVRYAPHLPLVLKGISCHIQAGTKVGIMGRTGSGKSTFFQTLFRFIELDSGSILIDGIDIAGVPLNRLRRSMAIIPQDPTLFMGTIRSNLDRYNEYTDEDVIRSLKQAEMWTFISSLPKGLQTELTEGGTNLSQGQRQLLCMARALLMRAKIIVMDEATASVDVQTDALLQKVIRHELNGITLIIIAHRLGTIKDCDQIIEIQDGLARVFNI